MVTVIYFLVFKLLDNFLKVRRDTAHRGNCALVAMVTIIINQSVLKETLDMYK